MKKSEIANASPEVRELYKQALLARERAYCPYSGHKVGAAIQTAAGKLYVGCNVENSSYGATVCAERVAIQKAVSEHGRVEVSTVMVVTHSDPPWPPCGMCRQVIAEFAGAAGVRMFFANLDGALVEGTLNDLFPLAFTGAHLAKP
jgi:cytidine deaminase